MRYRRETLIATVTSLWTVLLHVATAAYANGGFPYAACATLIALGDFALRRRGFDEVMALEQPEDTPAPLPANVVPFGRRAGRAVAVSDEETLKAA
jgi:hypothetical protein